MLDAAARLKLDKLLESRCEPCEGGVPPLTTEEARAYLGAALDWALDGNKIRRTFKFNDFAHSIEFVNKVAQLAEEEGHHPVIEIDFRKVTLILWTHAIGGLSTNDFILAAKANLLYD